MHIKSPAVSVLNQSVKILVESQPDLAVQKSTDYNGDILLAAGEKM